MNTADLPELPAMATPAATIARVTIDRRQRPLGRPYVLSFATLEAFVSLMATIELHDGRCERAEVVPLHGYSDETEDAIRAFLDARAADLAGCTLAEARAAVAEHVATRPFACSPLLVAIDQFDWPWQAPAADAVAFVVPAATAAPAALAATAARVAAVGGTLKVKLSGTLDVDRAGLDALDGVPGLAAARVRLDANQAYAEADAAVLLADLRNRPWAAAVDYLEQPLDAAAWDAHARLAARDDRVALMLDEPIVTAADVAHAAAIGVEFVKLKLFKQGGIRELVAQTRAAHEHGLGVVLGNGVATELANGVEVELQRRWPAAYYGASEANGFLKLAAGGAA